MKTKIEFKLNTEVELPQHLIDCAPRSGPFDHYAEEILQDFNVDVSIVDSIEYLSTMGAWVDSELQDLEINKARLLWLAILDCKENNTNIWYMGF